MAEKPEDHSLYPLCGIRNRVAPINGWLLPVEERPGTVEMTPDGNRLLLNMLAGHVAHHEHRLTALDERTPET